jgi:electron transfer flavoprotein beta subunit
MNIIVCIKQVPDTKQVQIDPATGALIRQGVPSILNPDDRNALEAALSIKDSQPDTKITVITMGPGQAEAILREAYAMGADEAILLSDGDFAGSDTWATSKILSAAIKKIGTYDIVLCGRQAIDGDTAQVGPQIAEYLNIPQITYVEKLEVQGNSVIANRAVEDGYYVMQAQVPVLLTVTQALNKPRYPSMTGIYSAFSKQITKWGATDIGIERGIVGLKGSPTKVKKTFTPTTKFSGERLEGTVTEMVQKLIVRLKERKLL